MSYFSLARLLKSRNRVVSDLIMKTGLAHATYFATYALSYAFIGATEFAYLGQYLAFMQIFSILVTLRQEVRFIYANENEQRKIERNLIARSCMVMSIGIIILIASFILSKSLFFTTFAMAIISSGINGLLILGTEKSIGAKEYKLLNAIRNNWIYIFAAFTTLATCFDVGFVLILTTLDLLARALILLTLLKKLKFYFGMHHRSKFGLEVKTFNIDIATSVLSLLVYNLPFVVLPYYVDHEVAGSYFLAFRLAMGPVTLISNAFNDYAKSTYRKKDNVSIMKKYKGDFKKVSVLSFVIYSTMGFIVFIASKLSIDYKILCNLILILSAPAALRLSYSSFIFIYQLENKFKENFFLYVRGSFIIAAFTGLSIQSNSVSLMTIALALGYVLFIVDAIIFNHRIVSK